MVCTVLYCVEVVNGSFCEFYKHIKLIVYEVIKKRQNNHSKSPYIFIQSKKIIRKGNMKVWSWQFMQDEVPFHQFDPLFVKIVD